MKFNLFIADEIKNYLLENYDISCRRPDPCSVHRFLNELVEIFDKNKTLKQVYVEVAALKERFENERKLLLAFLSRAAEKSFLLAL